MLVSSSNVLTMCHPGLAHPAADDNFDWATATGTWMVDIFAPWWVSAAAAFSFLLA
jgi:hypothetical protein